MFSSYLSNRKQFIQTGAKKIFNLNITCGVPQGPILGLLLFIIYTNELCHVSKIFEPIMFADDKSLFFSHKNAKQLFQNTNLELNKVFKWLKTNKLYPNKGKINYRVFHKLSEKDHFPLKSPSLFKFSKVLIDEHLTCKNRITLIKNKVSKNLGLLYRNRRALDTTSLKNLYFSLIHGYLSYGNIVWTSTSRAKLKELASKQKEALQIVNNEHPDVR